MNTTLEEFKRDTKWVHSPKTKKVRNSWGVYDYYKYYRTHRPDSHEYVLTESQYFAIVRKVNKLLVEELCRTGEITLPHRMGKVVAKKMQNKPRIINDKLVITRRIDWDKTLNLWYEDKDAKDKKTLVYSEDEDRLIIKYDKLNAIYKNKYFYEFSLNRDAFKQVCNTFIKEKKPLQYVLDRTEFGQIKGLYDEY